MRTFQVVLPQLAVTSLADDYALESLARTLRTLPQHFVFTGFDLAGLLANGDHDVVKDGDSVYLVDPFGRRIVTLAGYRSYLVESTNDKWYLTDAAEVYDGYFDDVPAALLQPSSGQQVFDYNLDS